MSSSTTQERLNRTVVRKRKDEKDEVDVTSDSEPKVREEELQEDLDKVGPKKNKASAKIDPGSWTYAKEWSSFVVEITRPFTDPDLEGMTESFSFTINTNSSVPHFRGDKLEVIYTDNDDMAGFLKFRGIINQETIFIKVEPSIFIKGQIKFDKEKKLEKAVSITGSGSWLKG